MDEKDWTLLATIINEENLNHAAEKLNISQPALAYRVRELEKELNIKIFIKGKDTLKFTKEGLLLVNYAKSMLVELAKLKDRLHELNQPGIGILKLTAGDNFANSELPLILSKFHQLHNDIKFTIRPIDQGHTLDDLANAKAHIALIRTNIDWQGPKLVLKEYPVCAVSKNPITFTDLPNLPRISYKLSSVAEKDDAAWWKEHFSVPPKIDMLVNKLDTCIKMIKEGFGYSILPMVEAQIEDLQQQGLYVMRLYHKDGTPHHVNLFAYYREEAAEITIVKTFLDFLNQYFASPS